MLMDTQNSREPQANQQQKRMNNITDKLNLLKLTGVNLTQISDQKEEYLKKVNDLFEEMKNKTFEYINLEYKQFEEYFRSYQKYQRYTSLCSRQLQEYLNEQENNSTLSSQTERICSMNIENLKLMNKKVQQSFSNDVNTLISNITSFLNNLEEQLQVQLQQQKQRINSNSNINTIIEDLKQLQIRINPLDEKEQQKDIAVQQYENLQKYFKNSQKINSQIKDINEKSSQQILELVSEQVEQGEIQEEAASDKDKVDGDDSDQRGKIDECIPASEQECESIYKVVSTSHILKEYPQRFNPQYISIPQHLITSYYSTKIITGGWDGSIEIVETANDEKKQMRKEIFDGPVNSMVYLKSCYLIGASASELNRQKARVVLLDSNTLEIEYAFEFGCGEKVVDLQELNVNESILESQLVILTETSIYLYSLYDYSLIKSFKIQNPYKILQARLVDNSNLLITTQQGHILHYSINRDIKLINTIQAHSDWVHLINVITNSNGNLQILTGSYDGKVSLREYSLETLEISILYELLVELLPQSLLQTDNSGMILATSNSLHFYEQGELKNSITLLELEEIQHISLLQNKLVSTGKSENSLIVIL